MDQLKVLGIKFLAIAFTVTAIFGVFNQQFPFGNLLVISLLTTFITYIVGDVLLLRAFGNVVATVSDFILVFAALWILSAVFIGVGGYPVQSMSLLSAFLITCVEPFIHHYMNEHVWLEPKEAHLPMNQVLTEFAEETDAQDIDDKRK